MSFKVAKCRSGRAEAVPAYREARPWRLHGAGNFRALKLLGVRPGGVRTGARGGIWRGPAHGAAVGDGPRNAQRALATRLVRRARVGGRAGGRAPCSALARRERCMGPPCSWTWCTRSCRRAARGARRVMARCKARLAARHGSASSAGNSNASAARTPPPLVLSGHAACLTPY